MPKVSIIITTYNSQKYILESITSVTRQTETDIEIIIVDDGSEDKTIKLALSCAERDSRIKVYPQAHRGKPSITRNAGLKLAQGQYVCFLDGDDLYAPEKVEREVLFLEKHTYLVAVFHDMKYMDEGGIAKPGTHLSDVNFLGRAKDYLRQIGEADYICDSSFYKFMSLNFAAVHTSSIMVRRTVLADENMFFAEDVTVGEDIELWWLIARNRQLGYLDQILSFYRQHDLSVTKNQERYNKDSLVVHIRNYDRCSETLNRLEDALYRKRIADFYATLGYAYFLEFRLKDARKYYKNANRWAWSRKFIFGYIKTFIPTDIVKLLKGSFQ